MIEKIPLLYDETVTYADKYESTEISTIREAVKYTVKHRTKDSVFTDLFQDKKYLFQLYKALHSEDTEITEDDLTNITLKNVFVNSIYNDLGFLAGNKYMILVEAQSTWTVNIIVRALMYGLQSYNDYICSTKQNIYKSKKISLPKPELYVVYIGEKGGKPDVITFSDEFFGGEKTDIDVRVRVIYEDGTDNIINQYIIFSQVFDEQIKLHGRGQEAIEETIRICRDRNVLREYLKEHEKEVFTIMVDFISDEEKILEYYIMCERHEAEQMGAYEAARQSVVRMIKSGNMTAEEIASYVPTLSLDEIKKIESEITDKT